jgi:uncharacterized membrane protein YkoI
VLVALSMVLYSPTTMCAAPGDDEAELARRLRAEGAILPLDHFVRRAQALRPGGLIDARLHFEREHDTYVYEIYMLDQSGDLWEVEFDASGGDLIELEAKGP